MMQTVVSLAGVNAITVAVVLAKSASRWSIPSAGLGTRPSVATFVALLLQTVEHLV